jgi:Elongator subunit Iki1
MTSLESLAKELRSCTKKTGIYIDSVQTLRLVADTSAVISVIKLFQSLESDNIVLFIPFHAELALKEQISLEAVLLQQCSCFIHLYTNDGGDSHCNLLLKKKSGKVAREDTICTLSGNEVTFKAEVLDFKQLVEEKEVSFNSAMNLGLTDEQRKQKDSVVLPYLEAQKEEESNGLIHYQPDNLDDYDDEDPDDDLDI